MCFFMFFRDKHKKDFFRDALKDYVFADGYDDPVYKALLEFGNVPDGTGDFSLEGHSKGTVVYGTGLASFIGKAPQPGVTRYESLDRALTNSTPVNIDETLYYVESAKKYDGRMVLPDGQSRETVSGYYEYTLVDPVSGERKIVTSPTEKRKN